MDGGITATSLAISRAGHELPTPASPDDGLARWARADLRPRLLTVSRRAIDRAFPKDQISTPYSGAE